MAWVRDVVNTVARSHILEVQPLTPLFSRPLWLQLRNNDQLRYIAEVEEAIRAVKLLVPATDGRILPASALTLPSGRANPVIVVVSACRTPHREPRALFFV